MKKLFALSFQICSEEKHSIAKGITIEAVNAGIPGKTSRGGLTLLWRDWLNPPPDIVLLQYMLNDIHYDLHDAERWPTKFEVWLEFILSRSALIHYASGRYKAAFPSNIPEFEYTKNFSPIRFQEYIGEYGTLGKEYGFQVVFVSTAITYEFPRHRDYTHALKAASSELGVPLIDAEAAFLAASNQPELRTSFDAKDNWADEISILGISLMAPSDLTPYYFLFYDPVHPSAHGHQILAEAIADELEPLMPQ